MCCEDASYTITKEYIEGARVCEKDLPAYDSEDKLSGLKLGAVSSLFVFRMTMIIYSLVS